MAFSGAVDRPICEHSAVLCRGEHDLSLRLRPSLQRAAGGGAPVLICVDAPAEARIRADFGSICERFTFISAAGRYATPGMAMAALHAFVDGAERSGAPEAWSIGTIPLRADGRDARWMQYEEAVDHVFADRPLRAVCLYDAETTPVDLRQAIRHAHQSLDGDWTDHGRNGSVTDVVASIPARATDLILFDATPAAARLGLRTLLGARVSETTLQDLLLIASELVTNAVVYGAVPTMFEFWHNADSFTFRVTDGGCGGFDKYAHLRPPRGGPHGGFGLWAVGQLADSVEISRHDDTTVVSVYVALP